MIVSYLFDYLDKLGTVVSWSKTMVHRNEGRMLGCIDRKWRGRKCWGNVKTKLTSKQSGGLSNAIHIHILTDVKNSLKRIYWKLSLRGGVGYYKLSSIYTNMTALSSFPPSLTPNIKDSFSVCLPLLWVDMLCEDLWEFFLVLVEYTPTDLPLSIVSI
jgi:hypothetical protein